MNTVQNMQEPDLQDVVQITKPDADMEADAQRLAIYIREHAVRQCDLKED